MRYRLPSGRVFTVSAYTPEEWGKLLAARMIELRCSTEYALSVADAYAQAERV